MKIKATCEHCKYWDHIDRTDIGVCRSEVNWILDDPCAYFHVTVLDMCRESGQVCEHFVPYPLTCTISTKR